jgi:NADH-quinone oxidoreductase subunit F
VTHTEHTYLVCRALDTDPRSRSRGVLLARGLEAVATGMHDAARTTGATKGYLCVDAADPDRAASVEAAVALAGPGIDVSVVPVEASLVLEDDSALLRVLEGRQAIPHVSVPPAAPPTLRGRPAAVLNLEDLMRPAPGVPVTLTITVWTGGEPLVAEVLETATVREVLRDAAGAATESGGVAGAGFGADGVQVVRFGGTVGRFLAGPGLDTPLGPATPWCPPVLEIVPPGLCGVGAVRDALRELSVASCGACVVCREGTRQLADMLADIADAAAAAEAPELMRELGAALEAGSLCGLGAAAADTLRTGLEVFASDFRAHFDGGPCPGAQADA